MNHSIRTEDTRKDPRKDTRTNNYLEDCDRRQSPHEQSLFSLKNKTHLPIIVYVLLNGITLPMELDTGVAMSIICEDTKHALFPDKQLRSSDTVLITYTSETVPVIVAVPNKDGKLRICGDYKVTINPSMKVVQHPLPKPDNLLTTLSGGKIFSKIDLSHAYQQMPLDNPSKELVTINTHHGSYHYNRLPFGSRYWKESPMLFVTLMTFSSQEAHMNSTLAAWKKFSRDC